MNVQYIFYECAVWGSCCVFLSSCFCYYSCAFDFVLGYNHNYIMPA